MEDDPEDSFDDALANISIPSEPKIAKLSSLSSDLKFKPSTSKGYPVPNSTPVTSSITLSGSQSAPKQQLNTNNNNVKVTGSNPLCILVHTKQRGNPILKSIIHCPMEFRDDILCDYVVGRTTCILYLSLKYHNLNPDYICQRLKLLGKQYELRVLLVQVDTPEPYNALKNLTRVSLLADLTLMLAWNADEAGKIIETYKMLEKRSPDLIMERVDSNPHQKLVSALTNIKPVNKTDAVTLLQNFGNLENLVQASEDRLSLVTGLGPRKAKKLYKTLQESFIRK